MAEDGFNAGWRDIGRFALWSIPYVLGLALGLAACVWLGFFIASRNFFNQLSQERRRAIYVGAETTPKSKLEIDTPNTGTLKVTRVDLDGSTAAVYFKNWGTEAAHPTVHWQLISPDGTLLESGWQFSDGLGGPTSVAPGETAEAIFSGWPDGIKLDKRAKSIRFWVEQN